MSTPARGYSWPPFEPGNQAGRRHGLHAADRAEVVAERVNAIAAAVADAYRWTAPYADERQHYARAVVDEEDLQAWLDEHGWFDEKGHERAAVRTLERIAGRAQRARQVLGLNPMSHARLLSLVSSVVRRHPERTVGPLSDALAPLLEAGQAALERGAHGGAQGPQEAP